MACSTSTQARKRMMPPTYFLLGLIAVVALRLVAPALVRTSVPALAAGAVFLAAGVWLNLASDGALKAQSTPVSPDAVPTSFVTAGVYRFTRNPMYLGMVAIVAGAALLLGQPLGLLVAVALLVVVDRAFVPGEERNLEHAFGEEYAAYRQRVRRWM